MKINFPKLLAGLVLVSLTLYGCFKSENDITEVVETTQSKQVLDLQEEAHVIQYSSNVIPNQYIVVLKNEVTKGLPLTNQTYSERQKSMKSLTEKILSERKIPSEKIKHVYGTAIKGFSVELTEAEVSELQKDANIDYIEQDQVFSVTMGGPPGGGGGGGGSAAQETPWGITRVGGAIDGTNAGTAWIIDSGIDLDHPDLNVDVARSQSFLSGGGGNTTAEDYNGHGTHVAGTVAAIDNSIGVIGVAAGAEVVAVRVLDRKGSGSTSGVIAGVNYVGANAASGDAANMSLGGGISTALDAAVVSASSACPFILAAGNESQNANNSSPARANGNNIYTVSSMTSTDNWSSFSNYGNPPVDYCAPGSSVKSTYKGGGYATLSGTSMAAPHVCGILLIGGITTDGNVNNDPDGNPDPIAHH